MPKLFQYTILLCIALFSVVGSASTGEEDLQNRTEGMRYYYAEEQLEQRWPELHNEDSIDFPSEENITLLLAPYLNTELEQEALPPGFDGNYKKLAMDVQQSWRLFHAGQYRDAYHLANTLGLAGILPKLRSLAINHHYFVESKKARKKTFASLIREIEQLQKKYKLELPAVYLLKAFAIGRYGQEINPISAFSKGLGGKLKRNIYKASELAPNNTEAIMFKAVFDAEAVNHAGSITSKLLYGASKKRARDYFMQAIEKTPNNTALLLEYGKACLYICARKDRDNGYKILQELTQVTAIDLGDEQNKKMAQQILDKQLAKKKPKTSHLNLSTVEDEA